ncbi:MAG: enoyl-CoA hydratase/isomerase family protein [Cellvibrionaceae bacterium]|nr:enoyl-CoA hydratase/isomerase family protein [Cellvibrionaceae bacterium]
MSQALPECKELIVEQRDHALFVTINRPQRRNAMTLNMVEEMVALFSAIEDKREIRAVVFRGAEGHFCAGGDLKDMSGAGKAAAAGDPDAFFKLNRKFGEMITLANKIPQAMITALEGTVMGGGFGLACISDWGIAHPTARFALPETSMGLPPAQIAPFVVARVGLTQARRLALFNLRIGADEAKQLGIVHTVAKDDADFEALIAQALEQVKQCAPEANAMTKAILLNVGKLEHEALLDGAARNFSDAVSQGEGPEGTMAFVEKRKPKWAQ